MKAADVSRPADLVTGTQHTGFFARPGEGKSYAANEAHKDLDTASIYFNYPVKEKDDYEVAGHDADMNTPKTALKKALRQNMAVRYKPSSDDSAASRELRKIYELAKKVQGDVHLFIDEAHRFDADVLAYVARDGRGHGIHVNPITQYPDDLDKAVIYSLTRELHFGLHERQVSYFRHYGLPFDLIDRRTSDKFAFVIYDPGEDGPEDGDGYKGVSDPLKV